MRNLTKLHKQVIKKVTPNKSTLPILKDCLIRNNQLIATDLESYLIIDNFTADNHVINAGHLIELNNINEIIINSKVNYITDKKNVTFATKDICEFPEVPECDYKFIGKLLQPDIEKLHKNRIFMSKDALRPALMHVEIKDNYFNITDGFKLKRNNINSKFTDKFYMNLKSIELIKLLGECDVYMGKEWIRYEFSGMSLISRNYTENYPDVLNVIPDNFIGSGNFNRLDMINAINEIKDYSDKENLIKVYINGKLELETKDIENNISANCSIECNKTGENFTIGYNFKYLLDVLKSYKSDYLTINWNTPTQATTFNNMDNSNLSLLMPVRMTD